MPKRARYTLAWSAEHERYELRERGSSTSSPLQEDDRWWPGWLEEHASFSFQGRQGHLNLLKEARARESGYWYAYRSLNRRTSKQYAGRTVDLTVAHLEGLAGAFARQVAHQPQDAIQRMPGTAISQILDGPGAIKAHTDSPTTFSLHVSPADPSSQRHAEPLLESKLHPPRVQAGLVERLRLFARLDAGLGCKLTLLCAPAGFGKTTLASQWLNARRIPEQVPPVAWISLDSGDNDPIRFWRYVITACQSFHAGVGSTSLAQISAGMLPLLEQPSLEQRLTPLLNALTRAACAGLLILEDYHLITEARIHETMIFFLEHLPATVHVLMLTRSEPPFPLVRWRARGELCEVQATDLRFSQEETAHFFQQALALGPILFSPEELHQLHERVEGWAAGLRLLALTLQGSASCQGLTHALAHFAGNQRSLQDYFMTEVLHALPEELQDFLVRTSILNRLTSELCDAVAERRRSERILEDTERAGLFLEALDGSGTWYRYHALFAEAMQAEAQRHLGVDTLRALHQRASAWYMQENMLAEAIEAAFRAQDAERAAEWIERLLEKPANFLFGAHRVQQTPEFHTLRRWLEQLPEALLRVHPLLCLGYAASLVFVAVQEQVPPSPAAITRILGALQVAEEGWRRDGNLVRLGEVYAFRAMVLRQPGATREAMRYALQALDLLPADAGESRAMVLWLIGMGEIQEGHFKAAREIFLKVRTFCEAMGNAAILRANTVWVSGLYAAQGELHQADASFRQLLAEARAMGDTDDMCDALLGLAQLAYAWNDLAMAEGQAQEAFELAKLLANQELQVQATLILAHIEQAHGRIPEAQQ